MKITREATFSDDGVCTIERAVAGGDFLQTFVGRLVRQHLVAQLVDGKHVVLTEEIKLVEKAVDALRQHLVNVLPSWSSRRHLHASVIAAHIRKLAKERLDIHEVDDEVRAEAFHRIGRESFTTLWPILN